jgi:PPM family protein phosphatase
LTALRSGSATDVGRVRAVNEDLALEASPLYGVADGMGGHVGGDVAARTAVEALQAAFAQHPTIEGLLAAVQDANVAVWERGRAEADLRGMGTTLTAAALVKDARSDGDRLVLVNVGDSRTYRLRNGLLEQLTTDHSVAEELVARGELTPEEAELHPSRHILTRALGVAPVVEPDAWEIVPRIGDRYVFCSDGLSNEVSLIRMTSILESEPDPQRAARALVDAANDGGGNDNITVVLVDVVPDESALDVLGDASAAFDAAGAGAGAGATASAVDAVVTDDPVPLTRSAALTGDPHHGVGTLALTRPATTGLKTDGDGTDRPLLGASAGEGTTSRRALRESGPSSGRTPQSARRVPRLVTLRVVLFFILVAAVLAGAWGLIRWYLDGNYFLSVQDSKIVVEQGKPGGFLFFDPRVVNRTGVTLSQIPSYQVSGVEDGSYTESSTSSATALVRRMVVTQCAYDNGVPSVTTTTTGANLPAIARCPSAPTPTLSSPSTTTTSSTSTTVAGQSQSSSTTTSTTGGTG